MYSSVLEGREGPREFLGQFEGILQTDGYVAYDQVGGPKMVHAACWAHARRKFYEAAKLNPAKRHAVYHAMDLNFRLKANSKAIDAALALPTINDGFTGAAPDLGALELGRPEPHYGPRWLTWKPFYR
jgi:hypothetical protein